MSNFLAIYKNQILKKLEEIFAEKAKEYSKVNSWGEDVMNRFYEFSKNGKMARGSIMLFASEMFGQKITDNHLKTAAAIEIFHASILVHDDIMDNDEKRRGNETIFYQYQKLFFSLCHPALDAGSMQLITTIDSRFRGNDKEGFDASLNAKHLGQSLGICFGDIGFFLAIEIIESTEISPAVLQKITAEFSREFVAVGLAQMQDVSQSILDEEVNEEKIINLYRYKTGRYTFALPLMIGALISEQTELTIDLLQKIGENLGIIFQIQDDGLGLLGDEETIGKPVGSDIRENKKTLYYVYLFSMVNNQEKEKLLKIFGNKDISSQDINFVKDLVAKYKIQEKIKQITDRYKESILSDLNELAVDEKYKDQLRDFLEYNLQRNK